MFFHKIPSLASRLSRWSSLLCALVALALCHTALAAPLPSSQDSLLPRSCELYLAGGAARTFGSSLSHLSLSETEVEAARGKKWLNIGGDTRLFNLGLAARGAHTIAGIRAMDYDSNQDEGVLYPTSFATQLPYFRTGELDRVTAIGIFEEILEQAKRDQSPDPELGILGEPNMLKVARNLLREMVRVTSHRGEIRISPPHPVLLHFLDELKGVKAVESFEVLPQYLPQIDPKTRKYVLGQEIPRSAGVILIKPARNSGALPPLTPVSEQLLNWIREMLPKGVPHIKLANRVTYPVAWVGDYVEPRSGKTLSQMAESARQARSRTLNTAVYPSLVLANSSDFGSIRDFVARETGVPGLNSIIEWDVPAQSTPEEPNDLRTLMLGDAELRMRIQKPKEPDVLLVVRGMEKAVQSAWRDIELNQTGDIGLLNFTNIYREALDLLKGTIRQLSSLSDSRMRQYIAGKRVTVLIHFNTELLTKRGEQELMTYLLHAQELEEATQGGFMIDLSRERDE